VSRNDAPSKAAQGARRVHKLISQQLAEATRTTTGELDVDKLVELVGAAYDEADRDRQWLLDAFDLIPEGIAIFDKNDRHVLWNRHYAEIYAKSQTALVAGSSFEDTLRTGLANGQYPIAIGREAFLERWTGLLEPEPLGTLEQPRGDDRVLPSPAAVRVADDRVTRSRGSQDCRNPPRVVLGIGA